MYRIRQEARGGLETRVSLKQALSALGFKGGTRRDTERNQWVAYEKEQLAIIMREHGIEWEKKGTHLEHLDVLNFKKELTNYGYQVGKISMKEKSVSFEKE